VLIVVGPTGADEHALPGHPERPARIDAVTLGIEDLHLDSELLVVPAQEAHIDRLVRVHSHGYLEHLRRFSAQGGGAIDADTYADADSWAAATRAAGAGLEAVEALEREPGIAFVVARPPGHHALTDRSMGFCLINNVGVTAAALVDDGERVLIVDWDVHHGNGTQELFWDEPAVLYVSVHQWPCYPGTGRSTEIGGPAARGATVNVPLPPGATGDVVRRAFDVIVTPAVERFAPTWVLVSAGFDAHRDDPLAQLELSAGDFGDLATLVASYAPQPGRVILFLEGGYDLEALRHSVAATLAPLTGAAVAAERPTSGGPGMAQLDEVAVRRRDALDRSA
jgi:acetoin utilization deacetylase AcuC-like enzyme